jgi:outer membrane protein, multidrug efflux system
VLTSCPNVSGSGGINYLRNPIVPNGPTLDSLSIQLNYIVDFWGKYRRATEAARAQLLATTYGRYIVQTTLISDVATAYFRLRQFDYQLDFSQRDVASDTDAVRLNTIK